MPNTNTKMTKDSPLSNAIKEMVNNIQLSQEEIIETLEYALSKAYKKVFTGAELKIVIDLDKGIITINKILKVVDDDYFDKEGDDDCEINISAIAKKNPNAKVGDVIEEKIALSDFDNPMVHSVMQLFKQKISEKMNQNIFAQWKDKKGKIIEASVESTDPKKGFSYVEFGNTKGFVAASDKIPGEKLLQDRSYKFYVKDVKEQTKGWPIILSRSDEGLVRELLRLEVPEIQQGIVEIVKAVRKAGFKTKVAVKSNNINVDPISTCIGPGRSRVDSVLQEINNPENTNSKPEKIDFIKWYDDPVKLIASACVPTHITGVEIVDKDQKIATVIVPNDLYSAVIGQQGANIRLVSLLTGWSIDVKKESEAFEENLDFVPINPSFYERRRNNLNPLPQFASADETLRNLENSKAAVENFLGIKDNQVVGEDVHVQADPLLKQEASNEIPSVSPSELNKPNEAKVLESDQPTFKPVESDATTISEEKEEPKSSTKEKSGKSKMNKTSTKIDYAMLKASSNSQNINSIESILESSDNTSTTKKPKKTTKKSKYSKVSSSTNTTNKTTSKENKKKNILDEFNDITKEYLEDDEDIDDSSDLDEKYDDTEYDK